MKFIQIIFKPVADKEILLQTENEDLEMDDSDDIEKSSYYKHKPSQKYKYKK